MKEPKKSAKKLTKKSNPNQKLDIKTKWQKRTDEFLKEVWNDYAEAQKEGFIRKDLKLDFMFYFNTKATDLLNDPKLQGMYDNMQDLIMEYANLFFYGIISRNNEKSES